ncbi:MAG TPA: hypothetical protein VIM07_00840 [Chitinophagaceae bacterium]
MDAVDFCYKVILFAAGKNLQNGYVSPSDFNLIFNQGQRSYSSFLLGSLQTYMPGRPISKVELGQNSVVRTRLAPTIYGYNLHVDGTGFSPYPGDYLQTDAMWGIYGHKRIRNVQQNSLDAFYNSVIDPIATNPIYLIEDVGFRFYPEIPLGFNQARLSYVRNPPDAVWGYDLDANGLPVYSAARSTQPVWDEASLLEVMVRTLALIGVNLQLGLVLQYSNEIKDKGQ